MSAQTFQTLLNFSIYFLSFRLIFVLKFQKNEVLPTCVIFTMTLGKLPSDYDIFSVSLIALIHAKEILKISCFFYTVFSENLWKWAMFSPRKTKVQRFFADPVSINLKKCPRWATPLLKKYFNYWKIWMGAILQKIID